jgi:putative ATPase
MTMDLFGETEPALDPLAPPPADAPLAERMRPRTLAEYVGQRHLVGEDKILGRVLRGEPSQSLILWGPPGSGKTTLGRLIAAASGLRFRPFSAVLSGIREIKAVMAEAERDRKRDGQRTLLFVDEIHRFNKAQQDAFLPHVERGDILLIGATTENPSFEVVGPLLSRARTVVLEPLAVPEQVAILRAAIDDEERGLGGAIEADDETLARIAQASDGDARRALTLLETAAALLAGRESRHVDEAVLAEALQRKLLRHDKRGEQHYDLVSALHKSVRNCDANAALYWVVRMLEAGEDRRFVARRLMRMAVEDVGLADPGALRVALDAAETYERLGTPEGELALAMAAVHLARAAKSNAVYRAYDAVRQDVETTAAEPVPLHLRNASTGLMKSLGYGQGYRYYHDDPAAADEMPCLPPGFGAVARGRDWGPFPQSAARRWTIATSRRTPRPAVQIAAEDPPLVAPNNQKPAPLGEILISQGLLTEKQLEHALDYKNEQNVKLGQALISLGYVTELDLAKALKAQGKIHCVHITPDIVDPYVAERLGEERSRDRRVIAFNRIAGIYTVAMEDPSDIPAVDELAMFLGSRVLAVRAEPIEIDACLDVVFKKQNQVSQEELNEIVEVAELDLEHLDEDFLDAEAIADESNDSPVVKIIQGILAEAFEAKASDIHLEGRMNSFVVRFRVDGVLFDRLSLPKAWIRPCIARLKVMSKLDIAQRRLPQDGRAQFDVHGKKVDARIATTPTLQGEGAVIRLLDSAGQNHSLDSIGMDAPQREAIEAMIDCSDGFVLATGPTGSGKTTTLYGMLRELNSPERKIITLEDPVEYQLEGATQISANDKIGLDFARGLRSVLRQDPDVVLVGEIRDEETAEIAVQASMTGHMVLSTLHTVGAAESVTRLQDMGIEPFLLADTLRGIIAQRLVRRVCRNCRRPDKADPRVLKRLGIEDDTTVYYRGSGCETCYGTGYLGRLGLYEVMLMTPELCEIIRSGTGTFELRRAAVEAGMTTLRQGGIEHARRGNTTLEEVLAATARE